MFAAGKTAGANGAVNYVEDVFSTYLYTGTGTTQTITNGIDLAGKGGLVWTKNRSNAISNINVDTIRGGTNALITNSTAANSADTGFHISSFNSSGYSLQGAGTGDNTSGNTYASWTFRKQPKFFDIALISHTNGVADTVDFSNLGTIGCVIFKDTGTSNWIVWHRTFTGSNKIILNLSDPIFTSTAFSVSGTTVTISAAATTGTKLMYAFAHDAGGFGLTGSDNVISCGSFVTTGAVVNVTLGYEPQFLLVKRTDAADDWRIIDSMRGFTTDKNDQILAPNLSAAETNLNPYIGQTATGFSTTAITTGRTYIYIAIRRGPMKVPTLGTSVFSPVAYTGTGSALQITSGFSADLWLTEKRGATQQLGGAINGTRLTGPSYRATGSTAADDSLGVVSNYFNWDNMTGMIAYGYDGLNLNGATYVSWAMRRAPGFFDVVCYTGTGATNNVAHNLGVAPELMIVKSRSAAGNWGVWNKTIFAANSSNIIILQSANASTVSAAYFNSTAPSSTTFTLGTAAAVNGSGATLVAYLFATCAGVSKVGSYTGTAALQTVACGFTTGARFVLIKRTDSTGDWYVWDSARGITSGNDPYLLINSTAAEVTATNYVDTDTTGFKVTAAAPAALNAVGGTYIFLAVS